MPWVKIDEGMPEHPKIIGLGPAVKWAHVEALCYCARNLTDGRVPAAAARKMGTTTGIRQLVEAGLWERDGADFLIHDYLEYNPSRVSVLGERAAARERMANARRSSPDVRPNIARSSPNPSPDPIPVSDSDPLQEPTVPDQNPPTPRKRGTVVDEDFKQVMYQRFPSRTHQRIDDEIAAALGHTAAKKRTDLQAYVRVWLTRSFEEFAKGAPTKTYAQQESNRSLNHGPYAHLINRENA